MFLVIGRSGDTIVKFVFCGLCFAGCVLQVVFCRLWVAVRLYGGRNFSRLGKIIRFSVQQLRGIDILFRYIIFLSLLVSGDYIDFDFYIFSLAYQLRRDSTYGF